MECFRCKKSTGKYLRTHPITGNVVCNYCEWREFVRACRAGITKIQHMYGPGGKMEKELSYPFAEKEEQYREYDIDGLQWALRDAREALKCAEEMSREFGDNFSFAGRKGPNWRADDVLTIAQMLQLKRTALGQNGEVINISW